MAARFRGKLASASLKLSFIRPSDCGPHRRFRGKLASASLKPAFRLEGGVQRAWIPRQACLGLIEAMAYAGHAYDLVDGFRGKLASASLKQTLTFDSSSRNLAIPRQACLGLIEALDTFLNICPAPIDRFRGKLASASLKRGDRSGGEPAHHGFRGKLASASLKQ